MKTYVSGLVVALLALSLWGCNQENNLAPADDSLMASARLGTDTTGFYCRDSLTKIAVTALPAAITSAISASYAGATVNYAVKDDAGNFLVAITHNSARKTLLFNANGTFNRELALRGKGPGLGHGFGRATRDSLNAVAIASLPTTVKAYLTTNFASSTITAAASDATRGYLVMIRTADNQRRTLLFNADGTFSQEVMRGLGKGYTVVAANTLPAAVTTYITANYAGATISAAGKSAAGHFKVVIQPKAGRHIDLYFAANGTFVLAHTRRK